MSSLRLLAVVFAAALVAGGLSAASGIDSLNPRTVRLRGADDLLQTIDWVAATKGKGLWIARSRVDSDASVIGVSVLRPNGNTKPYRPLTPDDSVTSGAAVAWPGANGRPARGASGLLVVSQQDRFERQVRILAGRLTANGKVKGLKEQLGLAATAVGTSPTRIEAAFGPGGDIGAVVSYLETVGNANEHVVVFQRFNARGKATGKLVELRYPDDPATAMVTLQAMTTDSDGWWILAAIRARDTDDPDVTGTLVVWHVPAGAQAGRIDATTLAEDSLPAKANRVTYDSAHFVPGSEPPTVFYTRVTSWPTAEARARRVPPSQSERFLQAIDGTPRQPRARMPVDIEPWPRVTEIYDSGSTTYPGVYGESTGAPVADGSTHLFAVGRAATLADLQGTTFNQPRQELSIYRLNLANGNATRTHLANLANDVGRFNTILLRTFGPRMSALFHYDLTFSHDDFALLAGL